VQGVSAFGIIDTAADIIIIGGNLFWKVASVACLKNRNLKPAEKVPRAYDQLPFTLDGRMELVITFGGKEIATQVYTSKWMLQTSYFYLKGFVDY